MAGTRELIHLPLRHHLLQPQQVLDDSHRIPNLRAVSWYRGVSLYPPSCWLRGMGTALREPLAAAAAPWRSSQPWRASPGSSCPPAASPAQVTTVGPNHPIPCSQPHQQDSMGSTRPHLGDDAVEAIGGVFSAQPDGGVALGIVAEVGAHLPVVQQLHAERPRAAGAQRLLSLRRQPRRVHEQAGQGARGWGLKTPGFYWEGWGGWFWERCGTCRRGAMGGHCGM